MKESIQLDNHLFFGKNITSTCLFINKTVYKEKEEDYIHALDIIGNHYTAGIITIKNKKIWFLRGDNEVYFKPGRYLLLTNPCSITEYKTSCNELNIDICVNLEGTFTNKEICKRLQEEESILFSIPAEAEIIQGSNKFDFFIKDEDAGTCVARNSKTNAVAKQIKESIKEQMICDDGLLKKIASSCNLTPSSLSKYFKRYYYISPVTFRNRARIFNSAIKILLDKNKDTKIIDVAFCVGFNDLSRFNKQFKHIAGYSPKKLKKI